MKVYAEEINPQAFAPFGEVIQLPQRAPDASGPGWLWWGENVLLSGGERPYAAGFLDLQPAGLQIDWAERHMHTDELLLPLTGPILVYVAPPDYPLEPGRLPPLETFRVFIVHPGQGVLLHKGVWHGAPLVSQHPAQAMALLLQGSSQVDGFVVRFPETPLTITL